MPFPYPKIITSAREDLTIPRLIVGTLQEPIGVNNRLKPIINVAFRRSLDPPKSPLRRGVGVDFDRNLVPPFLRGVRGDLGLIVKQQSVTGLEVKLTPMGTLECPDCGRVLIAAVS